MNNNSSNQYADNESYIQGQIQNIDTQENHQNDNNNNSNLHISNNNNDEQQSSPNDSPIQTSRNNNNNNFIKQVSSPTQQNKSAFQIQLYQLQTKLFHQVILKSQLSSQTDFDRQVLRKLSQSIKTSLDDTLTDIEKTQQKLQNPLLNYLQKQQIKQSLLELRMQQIANTKVLVNTYRHHEYRLVISLLHIAQIYLELNCHQQAMNHLENAIAINDSYRHLTKDVEYFHSLLLSFLALAQYQVQNVNLSLDNLNRVLDIHQHLKSQAYQCHDFFSLNLITKVLMSAGKRHQAISFANMAIQAAQKDYTSESIQYATGCKTLAQAQVAQNEFDQALQHLHQGIQVLQVHHPSKQQTIIEFYQKLTEITLKKLNTMKPQHPHQNYYDPFLETVKQKYDVIENTYGYRDKRVIKEKRHLASSLLKYGKIHQAQEELEDILQIQQVVYGQKSVEVAKTLKLLGTVSMSLNETSKAQKHLKKSLGIFHDQGQVNLQKQVQAKLIILAGKGKFLINNNSSKM